MSGQDILSPSHLNQKESLSDRSAEERENHQETRSGQENGGGFRSRRKDGTPKFEGSVLGLEFDRKLGQINPA